MMKTEYAENGGFLQRDSVEHEEYAEAYSTESREDDRKDGADLLEKVLNRDNLNKAYKRVKANKGAGGVDGMTIDEALPWLKEHRNELLVTNSTLKLAASPYTAKKGRRQKGTQTATALSLLKAQHLQSRQYLQG